MAEIQVAFPGNLKVAATIREFTIITDQPEKSGGDNSAPTPFELFTSSIATCAGYFALKFCRARDIEMDGMHLTMSYDWDTGQKRYPHMELVLILPRNFPEKYEAAIVKAMEQCVVKQHIHHPPEFTIGVRLVS